MSVGDRIRQRRIELGFSVEEVAAKLNKNRATVYRYEAEDIENMPYTVLVPLAKILQTTPAYLLGWTEKENPPDFDERIWQAINGKKGLYDFVIELIQQPEDRQKEIIEAGLFLLRQRKLND